MLMKRAAEGRADFWILSDSGKDVGIAYVIRRDKLVYLFYLAIDRLYRGSGYGTQAVKLILEQYSGCRVFLALEELDPKADNYEQRVKRHDFYLKCGLVDMPYKLKEVSVIHDIMGTGGVVEPEEYKAMIDAWMGWPLKHLFDMRIIKTTYGIL